MCSMRMDTEKGYQDEKILRNLYVEEGLTQQEIADKFDCSTSIVSRNIRKFGLSNRDTEKCPECGEDYSSLGQHWNLSKCTRPSITKRQKEIITGLLMGDGYVGKKHEGAKPHFSCSMINREFLEWVNDELELLATGVKIEKTAEKSRRDSNSFSSISFEESNANKLYRIQSRNHSGLKPLYQWYDDGAKKFPDDLDLTPLIVKMWYVSDGGLMWDKRHNHVIVSINAYNERRRAQYLESLWEDTQFSPSITERGAVQFSVDERDTFLNWLGEPPVGFEYKWETNDYDGYVRKKG